MNKFIFEPDQLWRHIGRFNKVASFPVKRSSVQGDLKVNPTFGLCPGHDATGPVLVHDYTFTVFSVEAASDSHVGLETGTGHVDHGTAQHVAIFGGKCQGQICSNQVTNTDSGDDLFINPEDVAARESIGTSSTGQITDISCLKAEKLILFRFTYERRPAGAVATVGQQLAARAQFKKKR